MSRKSDLEEHIRDAYNIVRESEENVRLAAGPVERRRNEGTIKQQRKLLREYIAEYQALCESINEPLAQDIGQIITIVDGDQRPAAS